MKLLKWSYAPTKWVLYETSWNFERQIMPTPSWNCYLLPKASPAKEHSLSYPKINFQARKRRAIPSLLWVSLSVSKTSHFWEKQVPRLTCYNILSAKCPTIFQVIRYFALLSSNFLSITTLNKNCLISQQQQAGWDHCLFPIQINVSESILSLFLVNWH